MNPVVEKLRFWIIDDLKGRRHEFEETVKKFSPDAEIIRIPHPLKLQKVLESFPELGSKINLFFSDYNMKWSNVEWDNSVETEKQDVKAVEDYDNFPGTQKVLEEAKNGSNNMGQFLLLMLSTMVVKKGEIVGAGEYKETQDNEWNYEEMEFGTTELSEIHKISKPFNQDRYDRVIEHVTSLLI